MSDFKGAEISDLAGLSKPISKLLDLIRAAFGRSFEATHVRAMAESKAFEIETIAQAVYNSNVPVRYQSTDITIDNSNIPAEFIERTKQRWQSQELVKQVNIESVIQIAATELTTEEIVSDEPVDRDWILRFFNSVEDICSEDMQKIWGKILAGEVKQPRSFSLRTLEMLKNMTTEEAQLFQKVSAFVMARKSGEYIYRDDSLLKKYGISFENMLTLAECGCIQAMGSLAVFYQINTNTPEILITNRKLLIKLQGNSPESQTVSIPSYPFTESGQQLFNCIATKPNSDFLIDCAMQLRQKEKNGTTTVTAHKVISITDAGIEYDGTHDILPPEMTA